MRKMIPEVNWSFSSYFVTFVFGITKQLDIWQDLVVYTNTATAAAAGVLDAAENMKSWLICAVGRKKN